MQVSDLARHLRPHLRRLLDRGPGTLADLVLTDVEPGVDQALGHFHVTLHAQMLADRIALVVAIPARHYLRGAGRQRERLAVPVKRLEPRDVAEPVACHVVALDRDAPPADLLGRVLAHDTTERLGDKLAAEAVAEHRYVVAPGLADERQHRLDPRQIVVHAHGAAHEHQTAVRFERDGYCIVGIDGDDPIRNAPGLEMGTEITGPLGGGVSENGDRLHLQATKIDQMA